MTSYEITVDNHLDDEGHSRGKTTRTVIHEDGYDIVHEGGKIHFEDTKKPKPQPTKLTGLYGNISEEEAIKGIDELTKAK